MSDVRAKKDLRSSENTTQMGIYRANLQSWRQVAERDVDTAEFGVDFHQHVESESTVLRFATNIEFVDNLRCDTSDRITIPLDRNVHLRGFCGRDNHEQLNVTATMKCRHNILLETSGDFVASPVQVGKLLHWFAVDDGHALVCRSLTKCLDEDVKVTVNFIATSKDEDSPILEGDTLQISGDEKEGKEVPV